MPIYEYQCDKCGHEFEELVFNEQTPSCPQCGAESTHKLMSCTCFHKEGGGDGMSAPASSKGSCAGCSGGHCSSCCH